MILKSDKQVNKIIGHMFDLLTEEYNTFKIQPPIGFNKDKLIFSLLDNKYYSIYDLFTETEILNSSNIPFTEKDIEAKLQLLANF